MKTLTTLALFAALPSALSAQRHEPAVATPVVAVPQAPPVKPLPPLEPEPIVRLEAGLGLVHDGELLALLRTNQPTTPFLGLLLAAVDDGVVQWPSLPPILKTDFVVAAAVGTNGVTFHLGQPALPFDVYLQGVALTDTGIASTPVARLAAREPAGL